MSIKFPFAGLALEQSILPTSGFEADELNAADVKQYEYPLFIRLETMADPTVAGGAAAAPGTLAQRAAGEALAPWVQCQTTYALLMEPHDESEERCRVVRQRIWVQSQFYDLQV